MNKLIRGVIAATGCVMLVGVSVAETSQVREQGKSESTEVTLQVRPSSESSKLDKWPMERHANLHVRTEETKDLLRGKRPK